MALAVWVAVAVLYLAVGWRLRCKLDADGLRAVAWVVFWLPMIFVLWVMAARDLGLLAGIAFVLAMFCEDDSDANPSIVAEHGLG